MAKIVQAVRQYGPKLERLPTAQIDDVTDWVASRTGLNRSELLMAVAELSEAILFFCREGRAVKLPDIGTFAPGIDREGNLRLNFRTAVRLKKRLAQREQYVGYIQNKTRIGWTDADYKVLWDAENPDDPLAV